MRHTPEDLYNSTNPDSRASARHVVPALLELCRPRSVVDIGCGTGSWLAVFRENGVEDVLGVDGTYIDVSGLQIPRDRFLPADLNAAINVDRTFDLAVSFEVAEHLPPERGPGFVQDLTKLAPVVAFSAAIPYQGGVHHVNEQWQDFWAGLFRDHGYVAIDCLRRRVWRNPEVAWYYAQNMLVFARREVLDQNPALRREYEATGEFLSVVHPHKYLQAARLETLTLRKLVSLFPSRVRASVMVRVRRLRGK